MPWDSSMGIGIVVNPPSLGREVGGGRGHSVFPDSRITSRVRLCCPSEALLDFPADTLMGNSEKDACEEK